jgi:hypothetical protein
MNASDPGGKSSRVEREVLEILERANAAKSPVENVEATVRRQSVSARDRLSKSARQPLLLQRWPQGLLRIGAALLLAIAAALIGETFRLGAIVLAIASAIAFFSLWVPSRASGPGSAPQWRGRDLHDEDDPPGFDWTRISPRRGPKGPSR